MTDLTQSEIQDIDGGLNCARLAGATYGLWVSAGATLEVPVVSAGLALLGTAGAIAFLAAC
jgi:hypothetical protein